MSDDTHPANQPGDQPEVARVPHRLAPSDPSAGPDTADRLTLVAHELRNMLDGSMRWLGIAAAALPEHEVAESSDRLHAAREQIRVVQGTLERMSSMVNAALRSRSVPIGSSLLGVSDAISLGMALDHAVDVVRPLASERGVLIRVGIDADAGTVPAGPLYTVLLNGLINAVQSIGLAAERDTLNPGGLVEIAAFADAARDEVVIEIADDGAGVAPEARDEKAFRHGVTTREDGCGIGLALARQIVESLEGVVSLTDRTDRPGQTRTGAVLRIRIPINPRRSITPTEIG